jgi:hypothetical protein
MGGSEASNIKPANYPVDGNANAPDWDPCRWSIALFATGA